ncbi:7-carboxy-7-deazaguanine synthase QueE [Streptosporangium oxazolinicum]|uniref:7-carboxy-7-deazaguanine synthase n=1 Tax=Streptosporangium oxazolinicum TaxID=909287 RepID=A0ABP8B534_9ACTN
MTSEASLLVAETFGPTLQGEGPSCGRQAVFIRLSRCNLRCSFCDTPYTWDWSRYDPRAEARTMTVSALTAWALGLSPRLVVITGGEPLLQQAGLIPLVTELIAADRRVEIETNGTVVPDPGLVRKGVQFNVSPKLRNAGMPHDRRLVQDALIAFAASGQAVFKFVAENHDDLDEIAEAERRYGLSPVWVMPEGARADVVLDRALKLADEVVAHGWHLTLRLQVLLWEAARGH